tara:strand:+ start:12 stop:512 length:501 start_codon:yes stop_codon:yes gene_type:complete
MTEIWKEINGYPDYKISTLGRVKSYKKEEIIKSYIIDKVSGYKRVQLYHNGKRKTINIHRLVALNFLPNYYNLPEVDHKDRNRTNNSIYNLRWVSISEQNINKSNYRTDIEEQDPKKRAYIYNKLYKQRIIDTKKFYCNTCNKAFQSNASLEKHYTSKKHITKVNI